MNGIAILTFHAAYNVGSVMQAYATQHALETLGFQCEIINYRTRYQKDFYNKLLVRKYGFGRMLRSLMRFPSWPSLRERSCRYESFINTSLKLTDEMSSPEEVFSVWNRYDAAVSGSDQIWNKRTIELRNAPWTYMEPYLLHGYNGRKVSYASSIGCMDDADLSIIGHEVSTFNAVSVREKYAAERLSKYTTKNVVTVGDPTLLLDKEEWIESLYLDKRALQGQYLLCYSLNGKKAVLGYAPLLSSILDERGLDYAVVISPFAEVQFHDSRIRCYPQYGPVDVVAALWGAAAVVTDSYHGTVFSVNFGKDFWSICTTGGTEYRKHELLETLKLEKQALTSGDVESTRGLSRVNYEETSHIIHDLRVRSLIYLRDALV